MSEEQPSDDDCFKAQALIEGMIADVRALPSDHKPAIGLSGAGALILVSADVLEAILSDKYHHLK